MSLSMSCWTQAFSTTTATLTFRRMAKESPEDILIQISVANRGPEASTFHVLPTLLVSQYLVWSEGHEKPRLQAGEGEPGSAWWKALSANWASASSIAKASHRFSSPKTKPIPKKSGATRTAPHGKDGINNYVVNGIKEAVNPAQKGTKASADYKVTLAGRRITCLTSGSISLKPAAWCTQAWGRADFEQILKRSQQDERRSILCRSHQHQPSATTQ